MVTIDQTREENVTAQVQHAVRRIRQLGCGADLFDYAVTGEEPCILQFAASPVHRHEHVGILREQRPHLILSEVAAMTAAMAASPANREE
jgi:hypothetical protein